MPKSTIPKGGPETMQCHECRALIPEYVRQELAQRPVPTLYPAVTRHLESCLDCEGLYDAEFHRQGLLLTLPELQALGHRTGVAQAMDQITRKQAFTPPSLIEVLTEYGRGWRDQVTGAWRQMEFVLSRLSESQTNAPAPIGLLGASSAQDKHENQSPPFQTTFEDAQLEVRIQRTPDNQEETLCHLVVVTTLYDRFGDYSGVEVTLQTDERVLVATTNPLGQVDFGGLRCGEIDAMRLLIRIPEN